MATKVYFPKSDIDRIKSSFTNSQLVNMNFDNICVSSLTLSNGNLTYIVNFEDNNGSNYIHATLTYNPQISQYMISSTNKNTTKPGNCLNNSQVTSNNFQAVTTRYDYYELTDNIFYHPQIDSILVIFFIITLTCIYFPYKIFSRAFGRWLKI